MLLPLLHLLWLLSTPAAQLSPRGSLSPSSWEFCFLLSGVESQSFRLHNFLFFWSTFYPHTWLMIFLSICWTEFSLELWRNCCTVFQNLRVIKFHNDGHFAGHLVGLFNLETYRFKFWEIFLHYNFYNSLSSVFSDLIAPTHPWNFCNSDVWLLGLILQCSCFFSLISHLFVILFYYLSDSYTLAFNTEHLIQFPCF